MRRNHTVMRLFAIALLIATPSAAWSQEGVQILPATPYVQYSVAQGMTQAQATALAQDDAGYLWIATGRGLNRFDGREFSHVTISDGLITNDLTAAEALSGNTVLIGDTNGYVSIVHDGLVTARIPPPINTQGSVVDIAVDGNHAYLSIERVGLAVVDLSNSQTPARLILPMTQPIADLTMHSGELRFVMSDQLFRLDQSLVANVLLSQVIASDIGPNGTHWLVRDDGTLGIFDDKGDFEAVPFSAQGVVTDVAIAPDGTVWVLSDEALVGYTPSIADVNERTQTYPNLDDATILFVGREGLVWLGAQSRLQRLQGNRFQHFDLRTGPASHNVWSITDDADGRLYFGTHDTILRLDENNLLLEVGARSGIPAGDVRDLVSDGNGSIWAGVHGVGLYRFDPIAIRSEQVPGTENLNILDLAMDVTGALWIATEDQGVFRLDTQSTELEHFPAPQDSSVYTIDAAADGNVWYGVDEVGLVRLQPDATGAYEVTLFGDDAGLGDVTFNHVNARSGDTVWIGAIDGALVRFEDGVATDIGSSTPLYDQSSYLVEPLDDGQLIVGGEQGLYLVDHANETSTRFGALDGFIALESNAHASFMDADGYLWIGTVDGATRMKLGLPLQQASKLLPEVVSVRSGKRHEKVLEGASIPWAGRDLAIQYAAVSLRTPRNIQYSYQLRGMHEGWSPPTLNRSIEFTGLAPGNYQFDVRARFEGHPWGRHIGSHHFSILKPFWLRTWFLLAALLAFALLIWTIMRLRTLRVTRANEKLRDEVRRRTQSIAEANKSLEASNQQLADQMLERRKADEARVEVESQLQLAFDNTPIGMGSVTDQATLRAANPALQKMLWPDEKVGDILPDFLARLPEESSDAFRELLGRIVNGEVDTGTLDAVCENTLGQTLQTTITLTAVRDTNNAFRYALLHLQDITESRKLTDQLEVQASYDELTGLLNRRAFEVELENVCNMDVPSEATNYLLFMDLDRFKLVNDTSGHSAGDALLKEVADIMRRHVRSSDFLGRLGGDEFGVILCAANKAAASRIAEAVRAGIEDYRFHWDNETHRIGISIGVVPIESASVQELQQLADGACYSAKNEGRNCVYFVEKHEQSVKKNRGEARWVQRLRTAMDNRLFALYGQSIMPLKSTDGPDRVEVLLRMRDPAKHKLIPPGAFLPAAERHGLSAELDQWVVSSLLDTLVVHDAFGSADCCYWVNLSGASIGDKRFADFLLNAMRESPLRPGLINFEITETAVIRNLNEARKLIAALRDMGCQFALDDFGSGLSSFGYLKKLPVDCVKIDGMFIRDIATDDTDRIFVKSIIDIAATMGIASVAEFVENDEILNIVRDLGADYAQGFAVHRPELISPEFPGNAIQPVTDTYIGPLVRGSSI